MSDVKCPHCKEEQEINHDDGYGYEEDETHSQDCVSCGKMFGFSTSVSYDYEVYCVEVGHELELNEFDKSGSLLECKNCDHYELKTNLTFMQQN